MKYSAVSNSLFLILLGLFSQSAVQGFQQITSSSSSSFSLSQKHLSFLTNSDVKVAKVALHASLIDPEQEPDQSTTAAASIAKQQNTNDDQNRTWKKIVEINEKFWDYTVNFFYVFMTVGILMNLSGFAYKVDLEDGFTVQTVKERRQELQWEREMARYDQEAAASNIRHQKSLLEKSSGL